MSWIHLPSNASRARVREAAHARKNRAEIIRELSWGRLSRRELLKCGLMVGSGVLAPIGGLSPFARSAYGGTITGVPRSPMFGVKPFTQPMPRFDVLPRKAVDLLSPAPTPEANQTLQSVDPALGGGLGPIEGRPPGPVWAHQRFAEFYPRVAVEVSQAPATLNDSYRPEVSPDLNSGIDRRHAILPCFHPDLPIQNANTVWTFNGTVPPKLLQARYGEPVLFRHHNRLPANVRQNGGFGRHTISTHEHNGHHGAENDGFTGAFFFPGQFYDYHWPVVLAGHFTVNTDASDWRASAPADNGGLVRIPGDWHETMSTHWFHDHMFSFTEQNVYKGNAAMFNIYSGLDRGAEDIVEEVVAPDGSRRTVNLRLPSGHAAATGKSWGNLEYDVNLMIADKAWDEDGQLSFDVFDFDGFLGDAVTVNLAYRPYFEVERRKYRFRILNASVARFYKFALCDGAGTRQQIIQIGNDGNLLPQPVRLQELDQLGIAERFDIVIDFSRYETDTKVYLVNLLEHFDPENGELNGRKPIRACAPAEALSGTSLDPAVGAILEFRIVRNPSMADVSVVPDTLIPNPLVADVPVSRYRTFEFGRDARQPSFDPVMAGEGPWGIKTDGGPMLAANFGRVSAAPRQGTREIWTLKNDGGGWDHPIHIHFEEALILARNGSASAVPPWERGRKDVFRLRPGGTVTISIQFRDWCGMFMEHCHNTTHEDKAMLLRWEIDQGAEPFLTPLPTPVPTPQGVNFNALPQVLPTAR